jgi:hypothetical protein
MVSMIERYLWGSVFVLLIVFSVPWFLWGSSQVIVGLPVWIWWHVGWMVLASLAFWVFSQRAWGLWIKGATG